MPVAGPVAADRAEAHYRWAERYSNAGRTRKAAAHFGRALDFGEGAYAANNKRVLNEAGKLVDSACAESSEKLREMGVIAFLGFWPYKNLGNERESIDVVLRHRDRDLEESVGLSVEGEDNKKLTMGEMLRRFEIALDQCAARLELDASKRADLKTHIMGHAYAKHIEALEDRLAAKKTRKEAKKES
jgi:hypothetical protein